LDLFILILLNIQLQLSAQPTSESVFLTVFRMLNLERAIFFTLTLLDVLLFLVSQLPSFAMTWVAEMVRAEAEEQGNAAAVSAFVVNEGFFMLLAISVPILRALEHVGSAFWAD
jgi:hypothetical protein